MLRIAIAGSVDDGKSTLVGRLLVDSKSLFDDHNKKINELGSARGMQGPDLAAVTDGLKDEREQGITIDVAYRYFSTTTNRMVLIDTPGHEQYTRNMVTGASNAHSSIILVDIQSGIKPQTKRHALIASLLGHKRLLFAVNKMDLVNFDRHRFSIIESDCFKIAARLGVEARVVPIAALAGDNVVHTSSRLDWFDGAPLLPTMEEFAQVTRKAYVGGRMAVRWVQRVQGQDGAIARGFTGLWSGTSLCVGDRLRVYPQAHTATVASLWQGGKEVRSITDGQDAMVFLAEPIDIHAGQVLATGSAPQVTNQLDLVLCWFDASEGKAGQMVLLQHAGQRIKARLDSIGSELQPDKLAFGSAVLAMQMNKMACCQLRVASTLAVDRYREFAQTGSFLIIDPDTNATLAAGMLLDREDVFPEFTSSAA